MVVLEGEFILLLLIGVIYCFNESLINLLGGPGNLYINPVTGTSLYSISSTFNKQVDGAVEVIMNLTTTMSTAPPTLSTTTESDTDIPDPSKQHRVSSRWKHTGRQCEYVRLL